MQTIRSAQRRRVSPAGRSDGEGRAYGLPAPLWRERGRDQGELLWGQESARRCRASLAANVNALHPQAKSRFAMRVLGAQPGFENRWARRLGRFYGHPVPSAVLFGLEPASPASCAACPARGDCPREGMDYRDLVRAVAEGRRLGIRLYLAAGPGVGRYWPELLDLALRNPVCTFLLSPAGFVPDEAVAGGAAAAGNVAFVFPVNGAAGAPDGPRDRRSEDGEARRQAAAHRGGLEALRAAGAPFGFVAGLISQPAGDYGWQSWVEGMLGRGYLFGFLHPAAEAGAIGPAGAEDISEHPSGRLRRGAPMPLFDLHEGLRFTGESFQKGPVAAGGRASLLVHPVTTRLRSLTLLESIEAATPVRRAEGPAVACPLFLDRGDPRAVLNALLDR